jgi:hypothetical protein
VHHEERFVKQTTEEEILHVVSQKTRQELFRQSVSAEWFRQELIARTAWAAAFSDPALRGLSMKAHVESTISDDGHVARWNVTLFSEGEACFRCQWPLSVLEPTALEISRQLLPWLGDGRVMYWVGLESLPESSSPVGDGIEFDSSDPGEVVLVPPIKTRSNRNGSRQVAPALYYPVKAILELSEQAYRELMAGIEDARFAEVELAWLGEVSVQYLPAEGIVVYAVESLMRFAAPEATAALCPVRPEELVDVLPANRPVLFAHTHVVSEHWSATSNGGGHLAWSRDDRVCFRRLSVGSVGLIAGSRPPLRVRTYGWPVDAADLVELGATVTVAGESIGG